MKRQYIVGVVAALVLLGAIVPVGALYYKEHKHTRQLEDQLRELSEKEQRLTIERSVSKQMEEIAYEQKAVSDEQREAANDQARIANEMKRQSDIERQHAIIAQENAMASEQLAIMASRKAEEQQELAERQREQAERARRRADTLSYQALARSLGSVSSTQWNLGNKELASLLAYASYNFAHRYHGDLYQPNIYESLMLASNSSRQWSVGEGAIMKMGLRRNDQTHFVFITTYGEVISNDMNLQALNSQVLFKDRHYDFRDFLETADGTLYVVSRTGDMVEIGKNYTKIHPINKILHPFRIFPWNTDHLLVIGETSLHLFNLKTKVFDKMIPLNFHASIVGRTSDHYLLIGKGKKIVKLQKNSGQLSVDELPFNGQVTTCTHSEKTAAMAYGMADGVIYLVDKNGKQRKLVAHRSRISRLKFDDNRLYSTSYDGTVNVWDVSHEKADPIRVLTTNRWVISFSLEKRMNSIWTGDQSGNLTRTLIDAEQMASLIRLSLKRNLTREEWSQYIGDNVPYVKFKP